MGGGSGQRRRPSRLSDEDRDGVLFLTSRSDQHASLRGLISTWLEIAVNGMLSLAQDDGRRIWVILDELPTLHQVPSLQPGLAESRQFGGCFVLGVQVASALRDLYGRNGAETISGLCGKEQLEAVTGERIAAPEAVEPERAKSREAGLDRDRTMDPARDSSEPRGRSRTPRKRGRRRASIATSHCSGAGQRPWPESGVGRWSEAAHAAGIAPTFASG